MVHILLFYKFLYIPSGAHDADFGKQHPAGIFESHRPRFPNAPLVQVRRHISELLTKAKADFREHFGTQLWVGNGWDPAAI